MERKKKKKIKIICLVCVTLAIAYALSPLSKGNKQSAMPVKTYTLEKRNLDKTVSATGIVSSMDYAKVSSQVDGKIQKINFAVGDKVNKGDVLCILDTELLELDIAQARNSLARESLVAEKNLELSEEKYNDAKKEFEKNSSSTLYSASSSVNTAKDLYRDSDDAYDDAKSDYRKAENAYNTVKSNLDKTSRGLELKDLSESQSKALKKAEDDLEELSKDAEANKDVIPKKEAEIKTIKSELDKTNSELDSIKTSGITISEDELKNLKKEAEELALKVSEKRADYNSADDRRDANKESYEDAKKEYNHSKSTEEKQLNYQTRELETEKLRLDMTTQQLTLEKLERQYQKSSITAPMSGTITAVFAKEGEGSNGVLFVIEDLESLKIDTSIKEYDISEVEIGMPTTVKSDALLDKEYTGELLSFSPTAKKSAEGETSNSSSGVALFDAIVLLTGNTDGIRVGMNTRINIVLAEKENVLAVPMDSVVKKDDGTDVIYIAEQTEDSYIAKEVTVTLGLENDFYVEITSDGLEIGAIVITQPDGIVDDMPINVAV